MPNESDQRKRKAPRKATSPAEVTMVRARDILGELVSKALFDGERTILTIRGRQAAVVVPIADLERLLA